MIYRLLSYISMKLSWFSVSKSEKKVSGVLPEESSLNLSLNPDSSHETQIDTHRRLGFLLLACTPRESSFLKEKTLVSRQ